MTTIDQIPQDDLKRLRAYQRQVEWLRNSKLLATGKVSFKFNTKHSFTTGETSFEFEGYDETEFLAVLPVLRQFVLQGEPVTLFGIHDVIMKHCERDELKDWVKSARSQWSETLNKIPSDRLVFFHKSSSVDEVINHLFYGFGGLFHVDLDKPDNDEQTMMLMNAALQKAFPKMVNAIFNIDAVIHMWLDDPNLSPPKSPTS